MSHENYKKIKFFTALTILLGTVIGIGIFFKNGSVIRANGNDGWGVIAAWLIGGVISLATALPFAEMGSISKEGVQGLPGWAEMAGGKKFGYFVKFSFPFFYLGILSVVLGTFFTESLINIFVMAFKAEQPPIAVHFILGILVMVAIILVNYFSITASGIIQKVSTILKFIPLLLVVFLGIGMLNTNNLQDQTTGNGFNLFGKNGGSFSVNGLLASLPMVLFAFDAFLVVGSMTKKVEGGIKKIPIVIIVGMVATTILYILITIAMILHGVGFVSGAPFGESAEKMGLFGQIFSPEVAKAMGIFTMVFITVSAYGVVNGIGLTIAESFSQSVQSNIFVGSKKLVDKFGVGKTVFIYLSSTMIFWGLVNAIPALIANSDASIDGISNFPTLFFFVIYATLIFFYAKNRNHLKTSKMRNWLFWPSVVISILGTAVVVAYQVFYEFTAKSFMDPDEKMSFGLFKGSPIIRSHFFILFMIVLVIFIIAPYLNLWFHKLTNSRVEEESEFQTTNLINQKPLQGSLITKINTSSINQFIKKE